MHFWEPWRQTSPKLWHVSNPALNTSFFFLKCSFVWCFSGLVNLCFHNLSSLCWQQFFYQWKNTNLGFSLVNKKNSTGIFFFFFYFSSWHSNPLSYRVMMKIWISQRKVPYKHSNQLNCRCLITPTIFFSFNSVISIQLRHRFLCSPLFLFSLLSLHAVLPRRLFSPVKKEEAVFKLHTYTHTERESERHGLCARMDQWPNWAPRKKVR